MAAAFPLRSGLVQGDEGSCEVIQGPVRRTGVFLRCWSFSPGRSVGQFERSAHILPGCCSQVSPGAFVFLSAGGEKQLGVSYGEAHLPGGSRHISPKPVGVLS